MKQIINVAGSEITLFSKNQDEYISLTDIAKYKNPNDPRYVIQNWMRTKFSIEFLGLWEIINNENFNRVEFGTFKNEAGSNAFVMTPKKWIENTNAIGITSKSGKYGGTYAHKDIAFEFASWISAEFKLYLITEFQRLKKIETKGKSLEWSVKRELTKINYKLQTNSIKNYLIPSLEDFKKKYIYADEADLLNIIIFQKTAKDWRDENEDKKGNIRDFATIEQLLLLANLENLNGEFIKQGLEKEKRYELLSKIAKNQIKILFDNNFKKLK